MARLSVRRALLALAIMLGGSSAVAPSASAQTPPKKGLAWAHPEFAGDYQTLGVSWWYVWGYDPNGAAGAPGYVPMTRCGEPIALPADYAGHLLVFNEPNNPEPYGCDLAPATAAQRYLALRAALPQARLVIGGFSIWALDWLKAFDAEVLALAGASPEPAAIAVHAYVEDWITADEIEHRLAEIADYAGRPLWVTEFGACSAPAENITQLTSFFESEPWIERYAAFTNRQSGAEPWAICADVALLTWDGAVTPAGAAYQQAQPMPPDPRAVNGRSKLNREASLR